MLSKDNLEKILNSIAKDIDITEQMFDAAEAEYKAMSKWIDANTKEYRVVIYPQGSFSLGTAVRPLDREDDFDIDFVWEYQEDYGFSAKELKSTESKSIISKYKRVEHIEEKRRCWQVTYSHLPNFHMDIIPAVKRDQYIDITDQIDAQNYKYLGSNPQAYTNWFLGKQKAVRQMIFDSLSQQRHMRFDAEIKPIKEYEVKTPLQKTIQLLKRHRDVMFRDDINNTKPISIIITTIAAQLYEHQNSIVETLQGFINGIDEYMRTTYKNGKYSIPNPTYTGGQDENFAEKWNLHSERVAAFKRWISQLKQDFNLDKLSKIDTIALGKHLQSIMGERTANRVINDYAKKMHEDLVAATKKIDTKTGTIKSTGTVAIKGNHHYGKVSKQ